MSLIKIKKIKNLNSLAYCRIAITEFNTRYRPLVGELASRSSETTSLLKSITS